MRISHFHLLIVWNLLEGKIDPMHIIKKEQVYEIVNNYVEMELLVFKHFLILNPEPSSLKEFLHFAEKFIINEHGHALLIRVLIYRDHFNSQPIKTSIVEVGSAREYHSNQLSTFKLSYMAKRIGYTLYSIDMDPANISRNIEVSEAFSLPVNYVVSDANKYLAKFKEQFDLIYLDGFDYIHENHSQERKEAYIRNLNLELSQDNCDSSNLELVRVICSLEHKPKYIIFDDIWKDNKNQFQGKGYLACDFLLENHYDLYFHSRETGLFVKKELL